MLNYFCFRIFHVFCHNVYYNYASSSSAWLDIFSWKKDSVKIDKFAYSFIKWVMYSNILWNLFWPYSPVEDRRRPALTHTSQDPGPGPGNKCFETEEIFPLEAGAGMSEPAWSNSWTNPSAWRCASPRSWGRPWRTWTRSWRAGEHGPRRGRDASDEHQSVQKSGSPRPTRNTTVL